MVWFWFAFISVPQWKALGKIKILGCDFIYLFIYFYLFFWVWGVWSWGLRGRQYMGREIEKHIIMRTVHVDFFSGLWEHCLWLRASLSLNTWLSFHARYISSYMEDWLLKRKKKKRCAHAIAYEKGEDPTGKKKRKKKRKKEGSMKLPFVFPCIVSIDVSFWHIVYSSFPWKTHRNSRKYNWKYWTELNIKHLASKGASRF